MFGYSVFRCPVCVFVPLTIRMIGNHAFVKIVQPRFFLPQCVGQTFFVPLLCCPVIG